MPLSLYSRRRRNLKARCQLPIVCSLCESNIVSSARFLLLILVVAALAGAMWFMRDEILPREEPTTAPASEPEVAEPAVRLGPIHPLAPLETGSAAEGELIPLPPLDDSDAYFLLAMTDVFGSDIGNLLVSEALIDKFVTTVDNLPRSHVAERMRPIGRLASNFSVSSVSDDEMYLDESNYARYDIVVSLVTSADLDDAVDMYRRFYPLIQESYVRLGYPDGYFNDRAVEVIDHLLETPTPSGPIRLERPRVLYQFADPELESLSSGQKLLIRMGSEHTGAIKGVLRELRVRIAQEAN